MEIKEILKLVSDLVVDIDIESLTEEKLKEIIEPLKHLHFEVDTLLMEVYAKMGDNDEKN